MISQTPNNRNLAALPPSRAAPNFQRDLVALIPQLRAFSHALCGRRAIAEDMAQEALAKAWRSRDRFESGTNLKAWLFTILRNEFYSHSRRAWREAHWDEDLGERIPAPAREQEWAVELADTARALGELPEHQREALILVAAGGFTYEDAARICDTPVGTLKSRVARARVALLELLDGDKLLPRHAPPCAKGALEDVLAQLTLLMPRAAASAAYA
jgi:RNA polymerase sigma-70 factor (ECF subfamily)